MGYSFSRKNPPFMGSFQHGTFFAVKYHGCFCNKCIEARRVYWLTAPTIREAMVQSSMNDYRKRIERMGNAS